MGIKCIQIKCEMRMNKKKNHDSIEFAIKSHTTKCVYVFYLSWSVFFLLLLSLRSRWRQRRRKKCKLLNYAIGLQLLHSIWKLLNNVLFLFFFFFFRFSKLSTLEWASVFRCTRLLQPDEVQLILAAATDELNHIKMTNRGATILLKNTFIIVWSCIATVRYAAFCMTRFGKYTIQTEFSKCWKWFSFEFVNSQPPNSSIRESSVSKQFEYMWACMS